MIKLDPRQHYSQLKEYYEVMSLKYDVYMKIVKFLMMVLGLVGSVWKAISTFFFSEPVQEVFRESLTRGSERLGSLKSSSVLSSQSHFHIWGIVWVLVAGYCGWGVFKLTTDKAR